MKKTMLLAVLGIVFITQSTPASELKSCVTPPTGIWIKLLINFHRPKLNCESGFGLCFLVTAGVEEKGAVSDKNMCPGKGQLNERNQLVLEIKEADIIRYSDGSAFSYFRDKTTLAIQDPYILPEATCRALGSNFPLTIKPGNYPVSFQKGSFTIIIQL